ncbi:MAG TPA: hypothetical protein VNV36_20780 [Pseudomonas sp.]|uniref:hypothetical protein n=1 Tax=Pseudomonas sp. TaxID=306 RepID=UPI002C990C49|nr:hypothetical protein [Pseudomonas sp.]HWH89192.1 hypothetical protein [Pseudomonas sp.]
MIREDHAFFVIGLGAYPFLRVLPLTVSLLQRVTFFRRQKGNPKGFAPAYGPLAGARGSFVTGPIRAQPAEGAKDQKPEQKPEQKQKPDQKIAAFGSSYSWIGYNRKKQVGCQAAFASRLAPTEKQKQKIAAFGSSYTMSVSSSIAFDLDPRATSEG